MTPPDQPVAAAGAARTSGGHVTASPPLVAPSLDLAAELQDVERIVTILVRYASSECRREILRTLRRAGT
ncbi:MAG: hypothetical protein ACLQGJ_04260 [Candidatus Dormibacteria bacterium]